MPGNKNSGRKRKPEPDVELPDIRAPPTRSQEKKCKVVETVPLPRQTRQGTSLVPAEKPRETSIKSNTMKSARVASIDFKHTVGPPLESFSNNRLPQKREILQRWKGLQIEAEFNNRVTTRDHAWKMWPEIQTLWAKSRIPLKDGKSNKTCIDKIVEIIHSYQDLNRTPDKRICEEYQQQLNTLFDISLGDEEAIEAALRSERREDWEEDLIFYRGQKQHPQLYTMGGIDLRLAEKEKRADVRKLQEDNRIVKEAERTAVSTR